MRDGTRTREVLDLPPLNRTTTVQMFGKVSAPHRNPDRLLLGRKRYITSPSLCRIRPVPTELLCCVTGLVPTRSAPPPVSSWEQQQPERFQAGKLRHLLRRYRWGSAAAGVGLRRPVSHSGRRHGNVLTDRFWAYSPASLAPEAFRLHFLSWAALQKPSDGGKMTHDITTLLDRWMNRPIFMNLCFIKVFLAYFCLSK